MQERHLPVGVFAHQGIPELVFPTNIGSDRRSLKSHGGSGAVCQEPYNEVIASRIMKCLGICGRKEAVDQMLVLDYLIVNEDRHQNNFGVIRNVETLDSLFVDDRRTDALCRGMKRRIEMLEKEAKCRKTEIFVDNTDFDVREDVSYSGEGRRN